MQFLIVLAVLLVVVLIVSGPLRREAAQRAARPRAGAPGEEPAASSEDADVAASGPEAEIAALAPTSEAALELADLQAARDAKYHEIRDAELDYRTGKLSEPDYEAVDQSLRAEAIEILRAIDRARERAAATIGER
jgi:hypothetical protein